MGRIQIRDPDDSRREFLENIMYQFGLSTLSQAIDYLLIDFTRHHHFIDEKIRKGIEDNRNRIALRNKMIRTNERAKTLYAVHNVNQRIQTMCKNFLPTENILEYINDEIKEFEELNNTRVLNELYELKKKSVRDIERTKMQFKALVDAEIISMTDLKKLSYAKMILLLKQADEIEREYKELPPSLQHGVINNE